jgi:aspartate-semialdehyde dehydrogenase
MSNDLTVALVGATGVVGEQFLRIMEERALPVGELRLLATSRSAGRSLTFRGETFTVAETTPEALEGADIAFISASTEASRHWCSVARDHGVLAFDDSSAFRMEPDVPLVVPEINGEALRLHSGIIATPNCSTVPLVLTLAPLMRSRSIRRVIVDTYQSVSGSGGSAVTELREQTTAQLADLTYESTVYPKQIAFNIIPQVDVFLEDGYTKEEWKMVAESRKILGETDLPISATCVRVPTFIAHAAAVHVELNSPLDVTEVRALWNEQDGLEVVDDPVNAGYPTPVDSAHRDSVFVGRARQDVSHPNGLAYWVVSDNLRKGAALNIVQMVEWMITDGCL